ncbi:MAG: carbohydrate ABC transporter permease [Candidatus Omnitrophota bacterium]
MSNPMMTRLESKHRKEAKSAFGKTVWYIVLGLGAITMLVPFFWMLSTSLKEAGAVFTFPPQWIPKPILWRNYADAWNAVPFGRFYLNSIFISISQTFGVLLTSSLAAYAFARLEFPGRDKLFFLYLATMMLPGAVTMIPVFILLKMVGWIDTYKALIIPGLFTAYGTFLLRQFFMSIPGDLEDAARIDGCSKMGIYRHVVIPLSKPALATLGTMTFIGSWNSFMWPLIVTNSMEKKTLPIGLASFQGLYTTDWTLLMAASIIVMVPTLVVFIFNQRFFVEGIKLSGMKG